ncbi:hypothetical protein [Luteococcus peritonei]|uniref:Uncharacterized protein n=1 Tax=Luteococcus peritonei TaxID=88874 RepID=A0ABW4RWY9_9ACTN
MNKIRTSLSRFAWLYPAALAGDVAVRNPELFLSARESMQEITEAAAARR